MSETYSVAIVGATGAVGRRVAAILQQRGFPLGELRLFASPRSAGQTLTLAGRTLTLETLTPNSFHGVDIVLSSVGASHSREWSPLAAAAGAVVIDNSSAWRMHPDVPLVVPEVNPADALGHHGIISVPNCATVQMVVAIAPLHRAVALRRVVVTTFQSVGGSGQKGLAELDAQLRCLVAASRDADSLEGLVRAAASQVSDTGLPPSAPAPQTGLAREVYPHIIAANVLPYVPAFAEDGSTTEERKLLDETRKIMHAPDLAITATCTRVPVLVGHSEAINLEFTAPLSAPTARDILRAAPGVALLDDPPRQIYPTPAAIMGRDEVFVGRLRRDNSLPHGLNLWVVADNLRKGAALNGVQIAETLIAAGRDGLRGATPRRVPALSV